MHEQLTNKPWLNYYVEPDFVLDGNKTLYEAYVKCNLNNADGVAYYTADKSVSHAVFKKMVDDFSAGIYGMTENGNIRVGALLNCCEEAAISLLAVNKIGGVIKFVDFTKGVADVIGNIIESHFDLLIVDEVFLELEKAANVKNVPAIIVKGTMPYDSERYISIEKVIENGSTSQGITASFEPNKPALIISSSGTTGAPKPIVHSNETVCMAVNKILSTDLCVKRNNVMISAVPPFIGLGIVTTIYTSLIAGMGLVFIAGSDPENSVYNVGNFIKNVKMFKNQFDLDQDVKINLFAAPIFYRYIASDTEIKDLSFMGGMLAAGSRMGRDELDKMKESFRERGCHFPICNGYGQNEMCGAITLNSISHNKNGSGGFPTIGTEVCVIDPITEEIMDVGKEGKIIEKSTSQFLTYENMPEETENAFIVLENGEKWFDTKDLGYLDEEGFIHITGRMTRVIVRQDMKIFADGIERKIKSNSAVSECAVVARQTDVGEDPIAFVRLHEKISINDLIEGIQNGDSPLSDLEMPVKFIEINEMPYLGSGKIDYLKLMDMAKCI